VGERGDRLLEFAVQLGDVGVQQVHPGKHLGQQESVMVGEVAGEGSSRRSRKDTMRI
jgi:hypothetical protein